MLVPWRVSEIMGVESNLKGTSPTMPGDEGVPPQH